MVPTPTSLPVPALATEMKSSGADDPAAMKVAPATSSLKLSLSDIASNDAIKKSSHTIANAETMLALTRLMLRKNTLVSKSRWDERISRQRSILARHDKCNKPHMGNYLYFYS